MYLLTNKLAVRSNKFYIKYFILHMKLLVIIHYRYCLKTYS